jgi:DNA-binding NarL/FixJ family response regulator
MNEEISQILIIDQDQLLTIELDKIIKETSFKCNIYQLNYSYSDNLSINWKVVLNKIIKSLIDNKPNIIFIDLSYFDNNDIKLILQIINHNCINCKVVAWNQAIKHDLIITSLEKGIKHFCSKEINVVEIDKILTAIAADEPYLGYGSYGNQIFQLLKSQTLINNQQVPQLTLVEINILRLIACGYNNPDISNQLGKSIATIKTHLRSIFKKLYVENRNEAVQKATQLCLI